MQLLYNMMKYLKTVKLKLIPLFQLAFSRIFAFHFLRSEGKKRAIVPEHGDADNEKSETVSLNAKNVKTPYDK